MRRLSTPLVIQLALAACVLARMDIRVYDAGGAGGFRDGPPVISTGDRQIRLEGRWEFRTGDHPDWAKMSEGDAEPRVAAFEKVEP